MKLRNLFLGSLLLLPSFPLLAAMQTHVEAVLEFNETIYAGTFGEGLIVSMDGGKTWATAGLPADVSRVLSLARDQSGRLLAGSEGAGLYRSKRDGSSWERWDVGLPAETAIEALAVDPSGTVWAGTTDHGLFSRNENMPAWQKTLGWQSRSAVCLLIAREDLLFAGTWGDGAFQSRDHGKTWNRSSGLPVAMRVAAWHETKGGTVLVGSDGGSIFKLSDDGGSWQQLNSKSPGGTLYQILGSPEGEFYTSTNEGVYLSSDGGKSWQIKKGPRSFIGRILWTDPSGVMKELERNAPKPTWETHGSETASSP